MLSDAGFVVNPKPGANAEMAGFGGTVCAVAVMLVLFWVASPVLAQQSCPGPAWEGAGTAGSPYQVKTLCQLQAMGASASALELTANWWPTSTRHLPPAGM